MINDNTYVDETIEVSLSQVVQDGSLVQVGHVGHVVCHLKLGWVNLLEVILLYCSILFGKRWTLGVRF